MQTLARLVGTSHNNHDGPDYSTYTLDQLYDARSHIDSSRYPERVKELERQISLKSETNSASAGERAQEPQPPLSPKDLGLTKPLLSTYLVASGVWSIAVFVDARLPFRGAFGLAAYALAATAYGGMIASGVGLWKRWRPSLAIGAIAAAIQVPFIQLGRLTYTISGIPSLEIKLWPPFGFAFSSSSVFTFGVHDDNQTLYLGVNVIAGVLTWALLYYFFQPSPSQDLEGDAEGAG
jgi:hypothetical protein